MEHALHEKLRIYLKNLGDAYSIIVPQSLLPSSTTKKDIQKLKGDFKKMVNKFYIQHGLDVEMMLESETDINVLNETRILKQTKNSMAHIKLTSLLNERKASAQDIDGFKAELLNKFAPILKRTNKGYGGGYGDYDRADHTRFGTIDFSTRYWGNWSVPPGEVDDGDYDWKVLDSKDEKLALKTWKTFLKSSKFKHIFVMSSANIIPQEKEYLSFIVKLK